MIGATFSSVSEGVFFLEAVKDYIRTRYDYILIDSRTGVSDTSGICTVHMPESLVICFTFNRQSIVGASGIATSVLAQREDNPIRILPVPTRVEDGEQLKLEIARDQAREQFAPILRYTGTEQSMAYWSDVEVPYKRFYAYEEVLATFGDRPNERNTILFAAEQLTRYLTHGAIRELVPPSDQDREEVLAEFSWLAQPNVVTQPAVRGNRYVENTLLSRVELSESEWRILIRSIQNDDCTLFLGPGIAFDPQSTNAIPLTVKLARTLAAKLNHTDTNIPRDNLSHIAQIYERDYSRIALEIEVEDFYRQYTEQTTDFHRSLAALPISLCVDLTPADLMVNAYKEVGKDPIRDFYGSRTRDTMSLFDLTPERPLVYELFGSFDYPDSLLLTENNLLDFLVQVAKNTPPLPQHLTSRFRNPRCSFLFLGLGFQHWHLRILLHVLQADGDRRNLSLALEDDVFFGHPDRNQTVLFYREAYRIQFRYVAWQAFADELSQRFHDTGQKTNDRLISSFISTDAPTVFLCHSSDDAEAVEFIRVSLQSLGVNTWVDRQRLRGNERWDQLIGKVIHEWVDYFVVLETPAMLSRPVSYYSKEIALALERAGRFRQGAKFIFPAQLTACEPLEELTHLQRIDLTTPGGLEKLAQAILADWAQRSSK